MGKKKELGAAGTDAKSKKAGSKKADAADAKKASKKDKKAVREADKAAREAEIQTMLDPLSDEEAATDEESAWTTDRAGNTISKAEANKKAEEEALRAAAKKRREAKAATAAPAAVDEGRPQWLVDYDKVKAKAAAGGKLSGKEKKLLKRGEAREAEEATLAPAAEDDAGAEEDYSAALEGFSLALAGGRSADPRSPDVSVQNFSISAPARPLIVSADLKLTRGRRFGLVGANGRGKSTLLRFLAARRLPVPAGLSVLLVEQEASSVRGASVLDAVVAADAKRTGLLKKEAGLWEALDADGADAAKIVAELAATADELEAADADGAEARARAVLCGLGFSDKMVAGPPSALSGGWRGRAGLARALFASPDLLLLDEPTNHLDLDAVLWLDAYLTKRFPATSTVLTVSHDRDFLDETCTDLVVLTDDGGLEYHRGGLAQLDKGAQARRAKRARDFALQQKTLKEERAKHPSLKPEKLEARVLEKLGAARFAERPREYSVHFDLRAPEDARTAPGLSLELRDVSFSYAGGSSGHAQAFRGFEKVNLVIDASTRAAVVGANGSGKSTLLKLLAGAVAPTSGEVCVGRNLKFAYYDQHFSELKRCGAAASAVEFLCSTYGDQLKNPQEARKWLGKFGLDGVRHTIPVRDLSGGQKARVVFASIALRRPHVLLLDEPTNHLDLESVDALVEGLEAYRGGVLAVTHDAALVHALSRDADGLECPLYACRDSKIQKVPGGFERYRRDVAREAAEREEKATAKAVAAAMKRAKARRERLRAAADKSLPKPPK